MSPKPTAPPAGPSASKPTTSTTAAGTGTQSTTGTTAAGTGTQSTGKFNPQGETGNRMNPQGTTTSTSPPPPPSATTASRAPAAGAVDPSKSLGTGAPPHMTPSQPRPGPSDSMTTGAGDPGTQAQNQVANQREMAAQQGAPMGAKPVHDGVTVAKGSLNPAFSVPGAPLGPEGGRDAFLKGAQAVGQAQQNVAVTNELDKPAAYPPSRLGAAATVAKETGQGVVTEAKQFPGQLLNKAKEVIPGQERDPERDNAQAAARQELAQRQRDNRVDWNERHPDARPEADQAAEQARAKAAEDAALRNAAKNLEKQPGSDPRQGGI